MKSACSTKNENRKCQNERIAFSESESCCCSVCISLQTCCVWSPFWEVSLVLRWALPRSAPSPPAELLSLLGDRRESAPRGTIREAGLRVAVCCLYLFQWETHILPFFNLHTNQHQWSGKNCSERGKANGREHSTMIIMLSLKIDENFQLGPIPNLEPLKPALPTMI